MSNSLPNKWKKHLILVEFGLRTKENLESEIHRYPVNKVNRLIGNIENELVNNPNSGMYIISYIPISDYYKLPNFCISSLKDLTNFKNSLDNNLFYNFSEVWVCKKLFSNGKDSIVGRISFNDYKLLSSINNSQIIEQVWNCSHREIEKFNETSNMKYLRASRNAWGCHYSIDKLNGFSIDAKDTAIKQFGEIAKFIEANREKVEGFIDFLGELDIKELCLEYMLSESSFRFIDWDTKNDKKVIDVVFPNENIKDGFVL